jgi:sigma-B regulation protein RsbU (phosphoserine phosphatase)
MTTYNSRILVVDDDAGVRDSYRQTLTAAPASDIMTKGAALFEEPAPERGTPHKTQYDVILTDCGENGIKAAEAAIKEQMPFAAAFVDMIMPGMDGAETARELWRLDPRMKIVIVTAYSDDTPDDIVRKVKREDLFYLRKPFNPAEIRQFARALTTQWNLEQEKELLSSKLAQAYEHEIATAAKIQSALLLGHPPQDTPGIEVSQKTIASQKVDGDFYDFYQLVEQSLDVVVGDVMGKGVPAALLGAAVKNQLARVLNQGLCASVEEQLADPRDVVAAVHSGMIEHLEHLESFVTLAYARFDYKKKVMDMVDCGHTRTIHFKRDLKETNLLQGENMPIGFPLTEPFSQIRIPFHPGDFFFFYSDGLTEAKNRAGEFYGEDRLADFVLKSASATPEKLIDRVHADIVAFSESETFNDDFTCVVVKIADLPSDSQILAEAEIELKSDLSELEQARGFTRKFCEQVPPTILDQSRIEQLVLAVSEAATNIIKHAYHEKTGQRIQIHAAHTADQIILRFFDWGPEAFSPEAKDFALPVDMSLGGRGLFIIKNSVDAVEFSRDESGKNCTILILNLPAMAP